MRKRQLLSCLLALSSGTLITVAKPAAATLQWTWHCTGAGMSAGGTLTTNDVANSAGYYQIIGITGSRNAVKIVRLQPTGTAIPGNEPYAVDNLISPSGQQLTDKGFGFALADGTFANPFFAHTHVPPSYLEFYSVPHRVPGNAAPRHAERAVRFTAELTRPASATTSGSAHVR